MGPTLLFLRQEFLLFSHSRKKLQKDENFLHLLSCTVHIKNHESTNVVDGKMCSKSYPELLNTVQPYESLLLLFTPPRRL